MEGAADGGGSLAAPAEVLRAAGYRGQRWGNCRSCGARVLWARTPTGKAVPLSEIECEAQMTCESEFKTYRPHFSDCPEGARWSGSGSEGLG